MEVLYLKTVMKLLNTSLIFIFALGFPVVCYANGGGEGAFGFIFLVVILCSACVGIFSGIMGGRFKGSYLVMLAISCSVMIILLVIYTQMHSAPVNISLRDQIAEKVVFIGWFMGLPIIIGGMLVSWPVFSITRSKMKKREHD